MNDASPLVIAEEVRAALADRRPVVALESTIITHGMPYPDNLRTAQAVEAVVRAEGAVPATIAVLQGRPRVGLAAPELEALAAGRDMAKASKRDLAALVVRGGSAGTTVAATMALAARAGVAVFATGGIGGVHRGAEHTFDISADLAEFTASPVAVICAGCKSILDIPKTLEYLETLGVPVLGYGTDEFPAFFVRESGERVDQRCDTPRQLAEVIAAHRRLGLPGGLLIGNPIPAADAMPRATIDGAIAQAVREAAERGIAHKAVTPFLLARIVELTGGASLKANIALVKNNATLAARVAAELVRLP